MIKELQANTIDPPDVELLEEAGDAEGEEEEEEQDDEAPKLLIHPNLQENSMVLNLCWSLWDYTYSVVLLGCDLVQETNAEW